MTTYSAVVTTGIYCRPGCGARPLAQHIAMFGHPAAAEAAGFRACYRCRPYRVAGPVPATAPELVCAAVQQIINGALDDGGTEQQLAASIGISARHLRRLFGQHLGDLRQHPRLVGDLEVPARVLKRFNVAGAGWPRRIRYDGWLATQRLRDGLLSRVR